MKNYTIEELAAWVLNDKQKSLSTFDLERLKRGLELAINENPDDRELQEIAASFVLHWVISWPDVFKT